MRGNKTDAGRGVFGVRESLPVRAYHANEEGASRDATA